ncbi:hypothetical protein BH23ACI1_BH23ACI1_26730 [soil metagenome]|nr:oligosaccharide flippase family protein [Acidobacteriota bacterium]
MTPASRRSAALSTLVGNGLTVGITVVQAFVLIPLCLTYLGAPLYGAWLAATEVLLWVQMLDAGLPNLLMQRVGSAVGAGDYRSAARWASTTLLGLLGIGLTVAAIAFLVAPFVTGWVGTPEAQREDFVGSFRMGVIAAVLLLLSNGCVGLSRGIQRTAIVNTAQVLGALTGLVTSIVLLVSGWGLWALATGLFVRAAFAVTGAVLFLRTLPATGLSWWAQPSSECAREIRGLVPSMSSASIAYVLANNSEILLVTLFWGPVPALVYALTRRALDGARNLLDTIAWAVSGGFAHLVSAADRHRARVVLAELLWLRLALACAAGAAVVAVNQAFVTLLFGSEHYGGLWLSVMLSMQMIVGGQSFLANFLWRSTGAVREGSMLMVAESVIRMLGMSAGLLLIGLSGAPLAAVITSAVALVVVQRRLEASLPPGTDEAVTRPGPSAPLLVFGLGIVIAGIGVPPSWMFVAGGVAAVGLGASVILWLALPTEPHPGTLLRWK